MSSDVAEAGSSTRPWNASFDDRPEAYDDLRASGHMARRRVDFFTGVVDATTGPVLEVGCGTGTLLRSLAAARPGRTFTGVEPLPGYVALARERASTLPNVSFEVGTGEALTAAVAAGTAGLVISVDALHHVADLDAVAAAVHDAAAPGARWTVMEPNRMHPYVWAYHALVPGERTFPVRRFLRTAERAGWRLRGRRTLFLYPSGVAGVPAWAAAVERRAERLRPISGAVVLELDRSDRFSGARGR
ncbi:methyltransferase domain-containing protein [Geodermatophilus sp. YIM 151500]|uniref:class I SAM-dependent methyltransferase n=1 Tax=Geodermatophilus sp. YIM 151500 TaxID=2984531 RepID=UPI0021E4E321|nr:class I SAM-dependent methyltransferase [Geodermatophilus sp. YIM 151500]MCV2488542.1 methyltransferase domain-containing protein [Geodermatophilus sp. YIM 151500]